MAVELKVPEVGESITDVVIGRWLKGPGDVVAKDDPLVEIETDKITLELPAPADGKVTEKKLDQGSEAKVGDTIGMFEEGSFEQAEQVSGDSQAEAGSESQPKSAESQPAPRTGDGDARIMPAARRLIDQHNLNPVDIPASGPGGRLLKEDVERFISGQPANAAQRDYAEAAPVQANALEEIVPMTPLRRRIADNLVQAQQNAALLTTFNEVDMTAVMSLRKEYRDSFEKQHGVRLGFMSFFVKASIDALKQFPAVNAEVRGTDIVYKNHYDIGIAVGTGKGLVVPVLRDADRMSFAEIELAINDYVKRISENKIKLEELQGGTFTITNGGVFGSMLSTPIINPPQSGVLGMHAITDRAVVVDGEIVVRPMMYLALSYDHRLVDGREAVSFLVRIKQSIEDPTRILMEV